MTWGQRDQVNKKNEQFLIVHTSKRQSKTHINFSSTVARVFLRKMLGAQYGPIGTRLMSIWRCPQKKKKVNTCCAAAIVSLAVRFLVRQEFIFITSEFIFYD